MSDFNDLRNTQQTTDAGEAVEVGVALVATVAAVVASGPLAVPAAVWAWWHAGVMADDRQAVEPSVGRWERWRDTLAAWAGLTFLAVLGGLIGAAAIGGGWWPWWQAGPVGWVAAWAAPAAALVAHVAKTAERETRTEMRPVNPLKVERREARRLARRRTQAVAAVDRGEDRSRSPVVPLKTQDGSRGIGRWVDGDRALNAGGLAVLPAASVPQHGLVTGLTRSGKTTLAMRLARAGAASGSPTIWLDCKGDIADAARLAVALKHDPNLPPGSLFRLTGWAGGHVLPVEAQLDGLSPPPLPPGLTGIDPGIPWVDEIVQRLAAASPAWQESAFHAGQNRAASRDALLSRTVEDWLAQPNFWVALADRVASVDETWAGITDLARKADAANDAAAKAVRLQVEAELRRWAAGGGRLVAGPHRLGGDLVQWVSLPVAAQREATGFGGAMLLAAIRGWAVNRPPGSPPVTLVVDEIHSLGKLGIDFLAEAITQVAAAGVRIIISTQTPSNLRELVESARWDGIAQNLGWWITGKMVETDDFVERLGTRKRMHHTFQTDSTSGATGLGSVRMEEALRVEHDRVARLEQGQVIISTAGRQWAEAVVPPPPEPGSPQGIEAAALAAGWAAHTAPWTVPLGGIAPPAELTPGVPHP